MGKITKANAIGVEASNSDSGGGSDDDSLKLENLYVPNTVGNVIAALTTNLDADWGDTVAGSDIQAGCFMMDGSNKLYNGYSFVQPAGTWSICGGSLSPDDMGITGTTKNLTVAVRIV